MTPFFSIIIPVYNVAPYLRECLDSVFAQTFTDWEAICVDDGSTDGSGAILDEYADKDQRFRVIHQANAGVSAARNMALYEAKGGWFLFLDGDDRLREDALATFLPYVESGNVDGILVHPYIPYWDGMIVPRRKIAVKVLVGNATKEDLIFGPYAANGYVISRIYRRSVFKDLRFAVGVKMAEDVHFWFDALCIPAKWMILNAEYYLYRQRSDSVCGLKSPRDCAAVLDSVLYAMDRIGRGMGMGAVGMRRYVERWPSFPTEYLGIFARRHCELDSVAQGGAFGKVEELVGRVGKWPFSCKLRCDLWLVRRRLDWVMPVSHAVFRVIAIFSRFVRLLQYIRERGIRFAIGKLRRQLLRQGEYTQRSREAAVHN